MPSNLKSLQRYWRKSSTGTESTLHQLAPYIGKLKVSIAHSLISHFSKPGEVIFDPFCGCGVVPLEALLSGRGVIANDINPYAAILTRAKLFPIETQEHAVNIALRYIARAKAEARRRQYLIEAPDWVRTFFHPHTLAETRILADLLKRDSQWFILANLLGILHHQRPGFLSYPASHLVPYLRTRNFPRREFPELYAYRDVEPRLLRKLERTYRRFAPPGHVLPRVFTQHDIRLYKSPPHADMVLTSPPYMNALDYGRDNRLRLWFLGSKKATRLDELVPRNLETFRNLMRATARVLQQSINRKGLAILVIGEAHRSQRMHHPDRLVRTAFEGDSGGWKLVEKTFESVPDIRRSRREFSSTKSEWVLVFERR